MMAQAPIVSIEEVIATVTFETGGSVAAPGRRCGRWLTWQRAAVVWCAHVKAGHRIAAIAPVLGHDRRSTLTALKRAWMLRLTDADFHKLTNLVADLLACSAADQGSQPGERPCVPF